MIDIRSDGLWRDMSIAVCERSHLDARMTVVFWAGLAFEHLVDADVPSESETLTYGSWHRYSL